MTSSCKNVLSLASAIIEQYFYSGLLLGWASLVYIMKEDGIYENECSDDDSNSGRFSFHNDTFELEGQCATTCKNQDLRFNVSSLVTRLSCLMTQPCQTQFSGNFRDSNDHI